ncbi:hypothetical protein SeMB42_g05880 [Synchytrium endobioticum]|uniref:Uncharacterized protein n=1 Tax=Synchytrium endobioticum TaxID=286115 RepID=A0A507CNR6_9FUNG|nr:hypothetical protein SeMB42_g05880 [Synchytrium endobioticum]
MLLAPLASNLMNEFWTWLRLLVGRRRSMANIHRMDIPQLTVVSARNAKFFEKIVMMVEVEAANILVDRRFSRIPSLR